MTDRAIIERARASLGVRAPVYVRTERAEFLPPGGGLDKVRAAYLGQDATGAHCVRIARVRGVARIYALAHEVAHAAQAERLGGAERFASAYRTAAAYSAQGAADVRAAYRRNAYERDAQRRGAEIAAEIAAELEEEDTCHT